LSRTLPGRPALWAPQKSPSPRPQSN
jgi:hypothetical protein